MQEREHTFTIAYKAGAKDKPLLYGAHAGLERATDLSTLTSLFSGDLYRDVNITFIIDDLPAVMLAYAERDRMVELSEQGECQSLSRPSRIVTHFRLYRLRTVRIRWTRRLGSLKLRSSLRYKFTTS